MEVGPAVGTKSQARPICGLPDQDRYVAEVEKFRALGVEHLVFDFRFKFDRWFEQIELLGTEVLLKLR